MGNLRHFKRIHRPLGWAALFALFIVATASPDAAVQPRSRAPVAEAISGSLADSVINLKQWKIADGGNDHWYGILAVLHDWLEADSISRTLTVESLSGHLATVADSLENRFIFDSILPPDAPGSVPETFLLGGLGCSGTWTWITGEAFAYTHWQNGEPDYAYETVLGIWGPSAPAYIDPDGYWNGREPYGPYWSVVEWGTLDTPNALAVCGNGVVECPEECDDGNLISGDGCTPQCFECAIVLTGDVNVSGSISSADIIYLVNAIFKRGPDPQPCRAAGDVNCSGGAPGTADIIYLVVHVFKSGPAPCDACTITYGC